MCVIQPSRPHFSSHFPGKRLHTDSLVHVIHYPTGGRHPHPTASPIAPHNNHNSTSTFFLPLLRHSRTGELSFAFGTDQYANHGWHCCDLVVMALIRRPFSRNHVLAPVNNFMLDRDTVPPLHTRRRRRRHWRKFVIAEWLPNGTDVHVVTNIVE